MTRNPKDLERFIQKVILKAGKKILSYYDTAFEIHRKSHDNDVLTIADKASNKIILGAISSKFPEDDILSEEIPYASNGSDYLWIIDPLDGTLNFSKAMPIFGVLIAVAYKREVIAAGIYLPKFEKLYLASKGNGTTCNGKKIHCSKKDTPYSSYGTGFMSIVKKNAQYSRRLFELETKLNYWTASFSAIAYDAVLVAEGKADWIFCPYAGGLWDFAAPSLILQESGCAVTRIDGKPYKLDEEFFAANPVLHKKFLRLLKK